MRKDKVEQVTPEALLDRMEKELSKLALSRAGKTGYQEEIGVIRAAIGELNGNIEKIVENPDAEVVFFRDHWPRFYSQLFYFQLLQAFEAVRRGLPKEMIAVLISREESLVADYFRQQREFWLSYLGGSGGLDHTFKRMYSRDNWAEQLSLVIDPDRATISSYKVAACLAYERYLLFLEAVKGGVETRSTHRRFEWRETKTAAVQLIKAQAEARSIYINGVPATAAQLRAEWEQRFGEELNDFDNLLYASAETKKDLAPYLTKLINALKRRRERLQK
jgi:hypothetical protein